MENTPENTGRIQDSRNNNGTFSDGKSGNPSGKPRGARNKATLAIQELLDGEAEAITRKAIDLAKEGDITALKLCLDRISPTMKAVSPPINLNLPLLNNLTDTARAFISAAANGEISPDIAAQLVSAVASVARIEEVEIIKHRLEALELATKGKIK